MPLLNSRVARRANGRHIAHPVGPIIAKRRVFMTPALAAAERCHRLHSGRDALALLRPEHRTGPRRPFKSNPRPCFTFPTKPRWASRFVGRAKKSLPRLGTFFRSRDLSAQDDTGSLAYLQVCSRRPSALAVVGAWRPARRRGYRVDPARDGRVPMNCLVCGNQMRLALVEPHDEVTMPGFEYRTFQCERCGDRERRFVFDPRPSVDRSSLAPSM